jgi:hypothetical protein
MFSYEQRTNQKTIYDRSMVHMLGYFKALLSSAADYVQRNRVGGHGQDSDGSEYSQLRITNASTKEVHTTENKSYFSALVTEVFNRSISKI